MRPLKLWAAWFERERAREKVEVKHLQEVRMIQAKLSWGRTVVGMMSEECEYARAGVLICGLDMGATFSWRHFGSRNG